MPFSFTTKIKFGTASTPSRVRVSANAARDGWLAGRPASRICLVCTISYTVRGLRLEAREQLLVDQVLVSRAHAVPRARNDLQFGALDDLGREQRRVGDRHYLVVVAMQDQRRHVDFLEILG